MNNFAKKIWANKLYMIVFAVIGLFGCFYLVYASRYSIWLGHDGVIFLWPIGKFMDEATPKEFFFALTSGFLGEDHLSPINSLYGYICYLLSSSPNLILNITTKIFFVIFTISSLAVVYYLWRDQQKLLIFFLLLTFNLSLTWNNMIYPFPFNLATILPLLCLVLIDIYIRVNKISYLVLFTLSFFLMTFSFENAFIGIPFLATYAFVLILDEKLHYTVKIEKIVKIYILMFVAFLPYMFIHYNLYGTVIPSSRASIIDNGNILVNSLKVLVQLSSEWSFGLIRFLYKNYPLFLIPIFFIVSTLVYLVYKIRLFSTQSKYLFIAFLFAVLSILYTGRYANGMWLFAGIIFTMILADIISLALNTIWKDNSKGIYVFMVIAIPFFVVLNCIVKPFETAEMKYYRPYQSSQTAYKVISEPADRLVLVRLPDSEDLMHPIAFWIGNKIYNREAGLWYYSDFNTMLMKNMNVESYDNDKNMDFNYFREFFTSDSGNREVILFENRNLYFRIYFDNRIGEILRAGVIPDASQDYFNINFPDFSKYNNKISELQFDLTFNKSPSDIKAIIYGGKEIKTWDTHENSITFFTDDLSHNNKLIINSNSGDHILELIEVKIPPGIYVSPNNSPEGKKKKITLVTRGKPCRYFINTPTQGRNFIVGTLDANESISFSPLLSESEFTEPFELTYVSFELNRAKRTTGKITINYLSIENHTINICCSDSLEN